MRNELYIEHEVKVSLKWSMHAAGICWADL
jgi:hypothetical protein